MPTQRRISRLLKQATCFLLGKGNPVHHHKTRSFSHCFMNRRPFFAAQVELNLLPFLCGMNFALSGAIPEECVGSSDPHTDVHVLLEVRDMSVRMMTTLTSVSWRKKPTLLLLTCMTLLGGCATLGVEQSTPPSRQ